MRSTVFSFRARLFTLALVSAVVCSVLVGLTPVAAAASSPLGDYRPPSDAPIVDHFRPPPKPWMAGNRGVDYGTEPGAEVWAAGDGRVIFAGQVGGQLHVTIEHPDGLRTSYSFLESISVPLGDQIDAGDALGIAGGPFHFGVRAPDNSYLDPEALLAGSLRPSVRLVPGTDQGLERLGAQERRSLLETLLDDGVAALSAAASFSSRTSTLLAHYVVELNPETHAARLAYAVGKWFKDRRACTESSTPVPSHTSRRIVVLVSGLGTASDSNTAWEIDTKSLGYADTDVVRYSYKGGQAPRVGSDQGSPVRSVASHPLDAIKTRPFDAADSQQSIGTSADHLGALLQSVAIAQPGVPIDVVGHSQGGVVARLAVERSGAENRLPSEVETLVTVSSPQQGAPLAPAWSLLVTPPEAPRRCRSCAPRAWPRIWTIGCPHWRIWPKLQRPWTNCTPDRSRAGSGSSRSAARAIWWFRGLRQEIQPPMPRSFCLRPWGKRSMVRFHRLQRPQEKSALPWQEWIPRVKASVWPSQAF